MGDGDPPSRIPQFGLTPDPRSPNTRTMRIITNADDLGLSPTVNQSIFGLMAEGLVTSATLLANGPTIKEACQQLAAFPRCSFGAHLNLTQFQPLHPASALGPLLNRDGEFSGKIHEVQGLFRLRKEIYEELCAQIDRLISLGVKASHLDSHHHVHTIPSLFPVLKAVQRKYGIRKVRVSLNVYPDDHRIPAWLLMKKRFYNICLRGWHRTRTTDAMTDLGTFVAKRQRIASRYESVEIMLHPGYPEYAAETALLRSLGQSDPEFRQSLISYHEL